MTFVDLVFPAFLFLVGMSVPFALGSRIAKGEPFWKTLGHVATRTLALLFIGMSIVRFGPSFRDLWASVGIDAFVGAAVVPVYAVFLMPDLFNFALVFVAYFFWLYKEVATPRSRWLSGDWSTVIAAILLGLIAGRDPLDPTSSKRRVEDFRGALGKPLGKFRLGRPREHYWEKLDGEVRRATEVAVRDMEKRGAVVREVSLPHLSDSLEAATDISLAEATRGHEAAGYFPAHAAEYSEEVRQRIETGEKITAVKFLAGLEVHKRLLAEFDAAFRDVDAVVAPATPVLAPLIGEEYVQIDDSRINVRPALVGMSRPANFTGLPAISVPCGFSSEGLPIGLQLIGREFDETKLLRIAHSYERAHDWNERHPRL